MNNITNQPIWTPSEDRITNSNMTRFIGYISEQTDLSFDNYESFYQWSVDNISEFWKAIWDYNKVIHSQPPESILIGNDIRKAKWFTSAQFNFAENLLRYRDDRTALIYQCENCPVVKLTYKELFEQVRSTAAGLIKLGVKKNDRVAAFTTNRPEAIITMLAASSIGAIFSSCSPDFGYQGLLDRFSQIKPKVLIAVDGYSYNGKWFDKSDTINSIIKAIDSIEKVVLIKNDQSQNINHTKAISWNEFQIKNDDELEFEQLPFDHPLYIMYSSGTTGRPKCIVHGQGGTLLQHLKELSLHTNLNREDVITYFTTCGWMMWNWLVSSLAIGASIYLYDGSPTFPNLSNLFKSIESEKITVFGTSPKFLSACEARRVKPIDKFNLNSLKTILSTGAPLSISNFEYVYSNIKKDVLLASISGGTDILSCFLLGTPHKPVYPGELQTRGLGMKVQTFNDHGQPVENKVGELVCTAPFPSRPIYFWNDDDRRKYHDAYFSHFENVWRHGDYIKIDNKGGAIVYGRSDATLNPGGVRIGTAEIYEPVEALNEIEDSIVIGHQNNNEVEVILFVVTANNLELDNSLKQKIKDTLKTNRTPRHVPSRIFQVSDIPRTLNGKKVELAVSKAIKGQEINNSEALINPEILNEFKDVFK